MRIIGEDICIRCMSVLMIVLMWGGESRAQFYTTGADPYDVNWVQYRGEGYRWIGAREVMPKMALYGSYVDSVVSRVGMTLWEAPGHVDILLHSRTSYSNGLVSWAPKRMELYLTPSWGDDCVTWLEHLFAHEYRHVVQMSALNRGFTKALFCLFGEQAIGLVSGLYVPKWFLEGDAVATETALTYGGRGRSGAFIQQMRALSLERHYAKYDAAYNGSYRERYPNYYHMGYYTVSYLRHRYGGDFFASVLDRCGRRSWSITPFNRELRRKTGKRRVGLYNEAMQWWSEEWRKEDEALQLTDKEPVRVITKEYADYHCPLFVKDGVIAYKETPEALSSFVHIDKRGKEKTIAIPSVRNEITFDANDTLLVWTERHNHVRWENGDKGVIMLMDMSSGKRQEIEGDGFYSSVSLAPNADKLVVLQMSYDGHQTVEVLSLRGELLDRIDVPLQSEVSSPRLLDNGDIIYVETTSGGNSIVRYDTQTKRCCDIVKRDYTNIRNLCYGGGRVYFTSDITGIDNIYCCELSTGEVERVTSSRFGADMVSIKGDTLLYSDYTAMGYRPSKAFVGTRAMDNLESVSRYMADQLAEMEGGAIAIDTLIEKECNHSSYSKWNLFNLHSWGLLTADASSVSIRPALSMSSQNLLGNMVFTAGINIDGEETEELIWADMSYIGFFPKLSLRATYGYEDYYMNVTYSDENLYKSYDTNYLYDGRNYIQKLRLSVVQPLQWDRGAWRRGLSVGVNAELRNNKGVDYYKTTTYMWRDQWQKTEVETGKIANADYLDMSYMLSGYLLRRKSERDIETRLGLSWAMQYRHTPMLDDLGSCKAVSLSLYVPGIGRHHTLSATLSMQKKKMPEYDYSEIGQYVSSYMGDAISMSRGYDKVPNIGMRTLKFNYTMPLFCPDWSVGGLLYLKRVWSRLFCDVSRVDVFTPMSVYLMQYNSVGGEVYFDTHWLRLPFPVTIGCRVAYADYYRDVSAKMLFSVKF